MRLHYNKLRRCWLENNCNGKRIKPGHLSAQQCHQSFRWWISCLQWGYVCGHFHLFFFSSFTSSLFFDIWVFLGFLVLTFPCFFFLQSQRAHINRWMESVWFYCQMHEQAHLAAIITLKFSSQLNKASFSHCNFILFFSLFHMQPSVWKSELFVYNKPWNLADWMCDLYTPLACREHEHVSGQHGVTVFVLGSRVRVFVVV